MKGGKYRRASRMKTRQDSTLNSSSSRAVSFSWGRKVSSFAGILRQLEKAEANLLPVAVQLRHGEEGHPPEGDEHHTWPPLPPAEDSGSPP